LLKNFRFVIASYVFTRQKFHFVYFPRLKTACPLGVNSPPGLIVEKMEKKERVKKAGRPKLAANQVRVKVTLMLTPDEIAKLKVEHEGYSVDFTVFCREKLLNRESRILRRPIPEDVKVQMSNILRMAGSVLLLAKNTSSDTVISDEFREMAAGLKRMVQRADFSINEVVLSQSLIASIVSLFFKIEKLVNKLDRDSEPVIEIDLLLQKIREKLLPFTDMYNLTGDMK
jgi:hypothetical protein